MKMRLPKLNEISLPKQDELNLLKKKAQKVTNNLTGVDSYEAEVISFLLDVIQITKTKVLSNNPQFKKLIKLLSNLLKQINK